MALRESLVPAWYPVLLAVLVAPGAYSVVAAGDQMTSPIRAAHELSIRVSEFLFR